MPVACCILPTDEIDVTLHRVVMSEGDLARFFLDNPMPLHVADVKGCDVGEVGDERLEGRELIFEDS
ncbi:MAG: hypothetical protein JWR73_1494, partial [Tardiphaga sp.]|nr:hypothetical protein [Tardiphaga sp.]